MRKLIPGLLGVAAAAGFSIWAYPRLPEQVATHFNLRGEPNGWSSPLVAAVLVPAIGIVMAVVFTALPKIDPRAENYEKFGPTYWTVANAAMILIAAIHILALGKALGWPIDMNRVAPLAIGAIFVLLGSLMTRIRPNWFMGIRTPWTLSSDTVWRKTHRFGGVAFVIAGVCMLGAVLVTASWAMPVALGFAVAAALSSVVYSYVVWKAEQRSGTPAGG